MKYTTLLLVLIVFLFSRVNSRTPNSPCPYTFGYKQVDGIWYGFIRLMAQNGDEIHRLQIKMSVPAQLNSGYVGKIERLTNAGNRVTCALYFQVHFPVEDVLPSVELITHNGKTVCQGPPASGPFVTTLGLEHTTTYQCQEYKANEQQSQSVSNVRPTAGQSRPHRPHHVPSRPAPESPNFSSISNSPNQKLKDVCGITTTTTSLVVHGRPSMRGAFPWLAAIFFKNSFICGGNLISSRHILTAAHCIELSAPEDVDDFVVYLGKHRLSEPAAVRCVTDNIYVHPDYQRDNWNLGDADIAIITVQEVQFSRIVRPVCVFNDPVDTDMFVGQLGTLAGWGRDERGRNNTDELRQTTVTIVDQNRCNSSHPEFLNVHRSFCAGGIGRGPCNGDSGGGLFVRFNQKWFLRGIVSTSIGDLYDKSGCDVHNYGLYTDASRFTDWINKFLNTL